MCFSAEASFTAGVLLTVIGTETIRKIHKPSQILFASIPLVFAFQQITEGVLWLAMAHPGYAVLQKAMTYLFLVVAQFVWPILIPLSVCMIEEKKIQKRILIFLTTVGAAVGSYYLYRLVAYEPYALVGRKHLIYEGAPRNPLESGLLFVYAIATIIPLFVSSIKRMKIFGAIIGLAFAAAGLFYLNCLPSVWCFFAAVASFVVLFIVRDAHKAFHFNAT